MISQDPLDLLSYRGAGGTVRPIVSPTDWAVRRGSFRARFEAVAGPVPEPDRALPLDVQVEASESLPAYTRQQITYVAEPGDRVPAYLFIPRGLTKPAPAALCLHPTSRVGKDVVAGLSDRENRSYAEELARRGYVTLAPDYPGMGENSTNPYTLGYASTTAKAILNHRRALDVLEALPEADGSRVACIGHSLGGHNTLFLGLFDRRVRVLVTSCGFTAFPYYMGGDLSGWSHKGYMPRIAAVFGKDPAQMPFDFPEILAVLAPRPVFICAPIHDDNFDVTGVRVCVDAARPVYALLGAPHALLAAYPAAAHDFPDPTRHAAYRHIDAALG